MSFGRRDLLKATAGAAVARSLRGAQAPPVAKPPNILFLFPDQLRHDFIEQPGPIPVRTPNVKKLMREGVWFTRAITPAPLCAPARACLASGMEYGNCRVPSNAENYPGDQPTFYHMLRTAGYHVMGCGKFDLHKPELDWGLDGKRKIADWGFSDGIDNEGKHDATRAYTKAGNKPKGPFMAYLETLGLAHAHVEDYEKRKGHGDTFSTPLRDEAYGDNWITRNGLALLDAAPKDRPWFLQVNFNGPHDPWDITASMEKRCRGKKFPQPNQCTQLTPENHVRVRQNYAAMIENIDRCVGQFLAKVRQRGELANTLIVFSSDHGEMLGDHDLWAKRHPYHGSVGVPMVVWGQDVKRGLRIDAPATTLDLPATFLDYARVERPAKMDSLSLRPLVTGKAAKTRDHVLSGMGSWRLVMQDKYKYVRGFGDQGPMLFDTIADPRENQNLAKREPAIASRLDKLLGA